MCIGQADSAVECVHNVGRGTYIYTHNYASLCLCGCVSVWRCGGVCMCVGQEDSAVGCVHNVGKGTTTGVLVA